MSSILSRAALTLSPLFVAALAFSTGCALESDSLEADDEEVGESQSAITASFDPAAAKAACEAKHQVWKSGTCTDKCMASFKLYAGKCYDGLSVDAWVQEDAFIKFCEQTLHGAWNKSGIAKCVTNQACSNPPGSLSGWYCTSNLGQSNPYWNGGGTGTFDEIPPCVGLGCGIDTNTQNSTDFIPDDRCIDPAFCTFI